MRALYIIGIVLSVGLIVTTIAYTEEYSSVYYSSYDYGYNSYDSYGSYGGYDDSYYQKAEITFEWAVVSLFFFLYFIAVDILGLVNIKRTTTKVLGIIGLCLSGIMILWSLGVMSSPSSISINEVGPVWALYGLVFLAFSIVGLVQAVKNLKKEPVSGADQVLDEMLEEDTYLK